MIRVRCPHDECEHAVEMMGADASATVLLAEMASHLRNEHDDENGALAQERSALGTPGPKQVPR